MTLKLREELAITLICTRLMTRLHWTETDRLVEISFALTVIRRFTRHLSYLKHLFLWHSAHP